jgi:hypothetical protein
MTNPADPGYRENQKPPDKPPCPACVSRRSRQFRWLIPIMLAFFGWGIIATATVSGGYAIDWIAGSHWVALIAGTAGFGGGAFLFGTVVWISVRRWAKGLPDAA